MTKKLCALLCMLLFEGCAPTLTWVSQPDVQVAEQTAFKAQLEPLTMEKNYFVAFRLTITNKSAKSMAIDWNKTRYIHNSRNNGGFIFKGIDPQLMKTESLPVEIIPTGKTLVKEIAPYKLLARGPFRDKHSMGGWHGINPGILPEGRNGARLVMRLDDQAVRFDINVDIAKKE